MNIQNVQQNEKLCFCIVKLRYIICSVYFLFLFSAYCCEGHFNSPLSERLECLRALDEFIEFIIENRREL